MNFLKNFSLRKLLENKKFTIPASIVLAFIFWLSLTLNQQQIMQLSFSEITASINLENTQISQNDMSIIGDISEQKFTVTVRGPSNLVSTLTAADFNLYASAAEVDAPGEYSLQVSARNSGNNEYEILSISPPTLDIKVDYIETEEFTIQALADGVAAADGLIAEAGVVGGTESDTVTIQGPRTLINKIERVVAVATVNKTLSASETFDAEIKLYAEDGSEIDQKELSLSTTKVKVTVPISKKKTVPVNVEFTNLPLGFDKSTIACTIDHPEVTIIGKPEAVDKITGISLSAIDLSTVTTVTTAFDVSAKLPDGVRLLDNIDDFKVTLSLRNYIEKTITVTAFENSGLSSGHSVIDTTTIRNVKVIGPRAAVNRVNSSNVVAILNLTDKKSGEHTITASFKVNGYSNVWIVGTYSTSVTIK